jgi:hypothetical protein
MKKAFIVVFCVIVSLAFVSLAGCGSDAEAPAADSPYVGTWQATGASFQDEEIDINEVLEGNDFIIDLHDDGTATVSDPDGDSAATWVETKKGVKVTGDEINMEFKDNGGKLECKILGVHMFFEKQ